MKMLFAMMMILASFSATARATGKTLLDIGGCGILEDDRRYIYPSMEAGRDIELAIYESMIECGLDKVGLPEKITGCHKNDAHNKRINEILVGKGYPAAQVSMDDESLYIATFNDLKNAYLLVWARQLCQ